MMCSILINGVEITPNQEQIDADTQDDGETTEGDKTGRRIGPQTRDPMNTRVKVPGTKDRKEFNDMKRLLPRKKRKRDI